MNKYEEIYNTEKAKVTLRKAKVTWRDTAVAALAADIEKATGKPVKISGPFGLRAEVVIEVGDGYLLVTPEFDNGNLKLFCDTGEVTNEYPEESLGCWNNMHHVRVPLPDSMDEILKMLQN